MSEKKCDKFESLFIFQDENALLEHIKTCPDCRYEYEKFNKVSNLIKEAAQKIKKDAKRVKTALSTLAASVFVALLAFFTIQITNPNSFANETIAYLQTSDYTYEQMGLPVDEYGFIMVDDGEFNSKTK